MKKILLFIICSLICPVFFPVFCCAQTILSSENTTIDKAVPLSADILYENKSCATATQYYCLYGQEKAASVEITIKTTEIPSLSFQLFDHSGAVCTPISYQYQPSQQLLQINYYFSAKEGYLLALTNLSQKTDTYSITYRFLDSSSQQAEQPEKIKQSKTSEKPKSTSSKKKTNKKKSTTSSSKNSSSSSSKAKSSSSKKTSSSNTNETVKKHTTTSKPKMKKPQSLSLSKTFLQIPVGKNFSLKANLTPKNISSSCQWTISNSHLLKTTSGKKTYSGNSFTAKAKKKGTVIITCRALKNKKLTASCTIKII